MDIIKDYNKRSREVNIGDIYRLLDTDESYNYLSEEKPLMKVTNISRKDFSACNEEDMEYCSKVHNNTCISFETIEGDYNKIFSCYCVAEYVCTAEEYNKRKGE